MRKNIKINNRQNNNKLHWDRPLNYPCCSPTNIPNFSQSEKNNKIFYFSYNFHPSFEPNCIIYLFYISSNMCVMGACKILCEKWIDRWSITRIENVVEIRNEFVEFMLTDFHFSFIYRRRAKKNVCVNNWKTHFYFI